MTISSHNGATKMPHDISKEELHIEPFQSPRHRALFEVWRWTVSIMLGWSIVTKAVAPNYLRGTLRFDGFPDTLIPSIFFGIICLELVVVTLLFANARSRWTTIVTGTTFTVFAAQLMFLLISPGEYPGHCGCGVPTIWDGKKGIAVGLARNILVIVVALWATHRLSCNRQTSEKAS